MPKFILPHLPHYHITTNQERRGWVVNTPASYSGDPGFKSLPR
jgi:hypothetical protein